MFFGMLQIYEILVSRGCVFILKTIFGVISARWKKEAIFVCLGENQKKLKNSVRPNSPRNQKIENFFKI